MSAQRYFSVGIVRYASKRRFIKTSVIDEKSSANSGLVIVLPHLGHFVSGKFQEYAALEE